eukprot:352542-Chlamydomonas_euryale.AAC.8
MREAAWGMGTGMGHRMRHGQGLVQNSSCSHPRPPSAPLCVKRDGRVADHRDMSGACLSSHRLGAWHTYLTSHGVGARHVFPCRQVCAWQASAAFPPHLASSGRS